MQTTNYGNQYQSIYPNFYEPSAPLTEETSNAETFPQSQSIYPQLSQTVYQIPISVPQTYSQSNFNYPPVVKPALTQQMQSDTFKLLSKAQEVASSVLTGDRPTYNHQNGETYQSQGGFTATPIYNIDLSRREYNVFSNRTENHYHLSNQEEKKDDSGVRVLAVVVGVIVAGISAYFLGKAVAQNEDIQESDADFQTLKGKWTVHKPVYQGQDIEFGGLVDGVVQKTESILGRQQANRTHKIAMAALFFTAGAAGVAGGLLGSGLLMGSGVAIAAATSVFALYKLGYYCFSTRDEKDAKSIENDLAQLSLRQANLTVTA